MTPACQARRRKCPVFRRRVNREPSPEELGQYWGTPTRHQIRVGGKDLDLGAGHVRIDVRRHEHPILELQRLAGAFASGDRLDAQLPNRVEQKGTTPDTGNRNSYQDPGAMDTVGVTACHACPIPKSEISAWPRPSRKQATEAPWERAELAPCRRRQYRSLPIRRRSHPRAAPRHPGSHPDAPERVSVGPSGSTGRLG